MSSERQDFVKKVINTALECSGYHAPRDFGLSWDEVLEVSAQLGLAPGETRDGLFEFRAQSQSSDDRLLPFGTLGLHNFNFLVEPEYRSRSAFQFVYDEFDAAERQSGKGIAIPRDVLVERGATKHLERSDVEVAVTFLVHEQCFAESEGLVRRGSSRYAEPKDQSSAHSFPTRLPVDRARVYSATRDVIERRRDGRPMASDPISAFSELLDKLGHGRFRGWWVQTASEMRLANEQQSPATVAVLSAALVEGALTFVVAHARRLPEGPMGSRTFDDAPRTWKIDDLVKSAAQGNQNAILDARTRDRATQLISTRQRIHAGRLLSEIPEGPIPDLRPEEARDARATAEVVIRKVVDWVTAHPIPKEI